jgi:hypothetical protein
MDQKVVQMDHQPAHSCLNLTKTIGARRESSSMPPEL